MRRPTLQTSASALLITASAFALITATPALAQQQPQADNVDDIVVTGTRVAGRSRLDSVAPVDVVTAEALQQRGSTELATQLAASVPALNFPRPSATDGTDSIRPATLRGQGPDQTLVLVNGVRRHATALVNTNGSVGRGSAAVDLNAIPSTAIERIEVLRDGAAAQYGSDAIAGVLNLRLRQASSGGGASVTYGGYLTDFTGFYGGGKDISDGEALTIAGWQGFGLGSDGFLTASVEYRDRARTNRSDIDPRFTPAEVRGGQGDPESQDLAIYLNAGKPLGAGWEAYGWVGYQTRDASAAAFYRTPTDNAQNPDYGAGRKYPNGYLPYILTDTTDWTAAGGLRGEAGGWAIDVNLGYGSNKIEFGAENTMNPTYGINGQTSFDAGSLEYSQLVFGADASRQFDLGWAGPLNVAFGLEARRETYKIGAGEEASYARGPVLTAGGTTLNWGSRGFTGFTPSNEVDEDRSNVGVYLDLEGEVVKNLTLSGALRYENYSDFGDNVSGKIAGRYDFNPHFAIRGAVSTGFRAPSLQQQYYTQTAVLYINNVPYETGTYPSISDVGAALGGTALEAETSVNYSLGFVVRNGPFELTADAYRIDIDDRIILSETLTGSNTAAPGSNAKTIFDLLAPYGATAARFFINGVDTETTGLDVVARYRAETSVGHRLDFTLAGNVNDFKVTKTPMTQTGILPTPTSLFGRQAVTRFEEGTPPWKVVFQTDWEAQRLGGTFRLTGYGDVLAAGASEATDLQLGDALVADVEARYRFNDRVTVSIGADNILDQYPRQSLRENNTTGAFPFSNFSPYGFNGRFVYGRLAVKW